MQLAPVGCLSPKEAAAASSISDRRKPNIQFPGYFRWTGLAALLIVEVTALSVAFDARVRSDDPGWAGYLVFKSPHLLRGALVAVVVAAVLTWWFFGYEIRAAARENRSRRAMMGWLTAHLAALAILVFTTNGVLGESTRGASISTWDLLAWLLSGALAVGFLAAAALSPRAWPRLIWKVRWVFLAAALLGVATDLSTRVFQSRWESLAGPTLWVSHQILRVFANDAVCDSDSFVIGTESFRVTVSPACSGYEGMALIAAYLGGYIWLFRRELRLPHALLLLPVGIAVIWLANAARIAVLVLIGDRISPALALGGFHSQAGWLAFNAVAIVLVAASHRLGLFIRESTPGPPAAENATVAYLAPVTVGIAIQAVATAFISEPDAAYVLRTVAAGLLLWYLWPRYESLHQSSVPTHGTVFALAVGIAVYLIWVPLAGDSGQDILAATAESDALPPALLAVLVFARVIGFVVVTPLAEELAFRGYLMRRLIAADFRSVPVGRFTWVSFLVSSVLFGVLHGEWVAGTLAGMAYAMVVYRTGRLRDAVLAHAVTNGLLMIAPTYRYLVP